NAVTVTTLGEVASLAGAFTVTEGSAAILSITPNTARQNQTVSVTIAGQFPHFGATSAVSFGSGITVTAVTANSATQLTASITIAPDAALGSREVTVSTGTETVTATSMFGVLAGLPQLLSVSPNTGGQATTQTVTITGLYTNFVQGSTQISFSGTGVTAGTPTVNGPTQLQVSVTVSNGAAPGPRSVTVTTGTETAPFASAFVVQPGPPT